jgi:hypothetical protein
MAEPAISDNLAELRASLTQLKREAAKVVAEMQLGGDRRKRRELARALEHCKRHGKTVERLVDQLLSNETPALAEEEQTEVEQAKRFLGQLQEFQAF